MSKDKKQLLVVGVLGLAILAIGAFQFLAPKGPAAVAPEPKDADSISGSAEVAVEDTSTPIDPKTKLLGDLLGKVEPRDPFLAQAIIVVEPDTDPDGQPTKVDPPKPVRPIALPGGGGFGPVDPNVGGGGVTSGDPLIQPGEFAYRLKGVLIGATRNIAVFEDRNGNQKLVGEGATFGSDSETEVISINAEGVTIRHRGSTQVLKVEEG